MIIPMMFSRAADLFFKIPLRQLAVYLYLIMLVRTGIWVMGSMPEQIVVVFSPFLNKIPFDQSHYVFWNYLGPLSAHLLFTPFHLSTPIAYVTPYFIYCLFFAAIGTALFCHLVTTRLDDHAARASLLIYFLLPVAGTTYFWVGMDGLTFLLLLLPFVMPRNAWWGAGIGFLLGLQHFEQGFLAYLAVLASLYLTGKNAEATDVSKPWATSVLGGILLGKLALILWFSYIDLNVASDRFSWMMDHERRTLFYAMLHPHVMFASLMGVAWLVVGRLAFFRQANLPFFVPFTVLLLLPFIVEDETRVFSLVAFPLLAYWILFNPKFLQSLEHDFLGLLVVLMIIVPWMWVWRGEPRWSAFPYDLGYAWAKVFDSPWLPDDLFRWVFHWE
jgi:hypothetical protein